MALSLRHSLRQTRSLSNRNSSNKELTFHRRSKVIPRPYAVSVFASAEQQQFTADDHPSTHTDHVSSNGMSTSVATQDPPEISYVPMTDLERFWTSTKLVVALPWRRFQSGSALVIKLSGSISEKLQSRFSPTPSLPALCDALEKAAYDPRITGLVVRIDPLAVGWGKVIELRRYVELFKQSGKFTIAYMERAGEKEYYLASAFNEIFVPPSGGLSLRGFAATGSFLRGALEKVGIQPEVRRIGEYKSAGDQILRKDMSDAQKEQLNAILDDVSKHWVSTVAAARNKSESEVLEMLDRGIYDMSDFKSGGWVTDLKYEDEIEDLLKARTGGKDDQVRAVKYDRYKKVSRSAFGIDGGKLIAVVRASGAITGGDGGGVGGSGITAKPFIAELRRLAKNKKVAAIVLRVDSPGGDALASDLMWREIQQLGKKKPIIASMSDVAASGGYYMAMGAQKIVAEFLTITGSIGVVTGKFNLQELYNDKIGYNKVILSRGKYAQLLAENKAFTEEESSLFDKAAQFAYESFRNKAAASRQMAVDDMQEKAQGRVWTGQAALNVGLVDSIGGLNKAVALAKEAAGIPAQDKVRLMEVSRAQTSPLALLSGGGALVQLILGITAVISQGVSGQLSVAQVFEQALQSVLSLGGGIVTGGGAVGQPSAKLPMDITIDGVASQSLHLLPEPVKNSSPSSHANSYTTGETLFD